MDTQKAPQKVTVTDNYGVSDWSLQVQQKRQFTDDRQQELKNAQLRFQHGNVVQEASNTAKGKLDFQPKFVINPGETPKTLMNLTKTGTYQKEKIEDDQSSATNRYDDPEKASGTTNLVIDRQPAVVLGFSYQQRLNGTIQNIRPS